MDKYKFGEFIYQKRKKQGLTQEELGKRLGVTNKAVSKWEVGETTPDITMLEPLAKELQVTVDELLKQEMYDFTGSDIHHENHTKSFSNKLMIKNIKQFEKVLANNSKVFK